MQSMTGFGSKSAANDRWQIQINIQAVNHKRLDIYIYSPLFIKSEEYIIRKTVSQFILRGKVNIEIAAQPIKDSINGFEINDAVVNEVLEYAREKAEVIEPLSVATVIKTLALPQTLLVEGPEFNDEDKVFLMAVLKEALTSFKEASSQEGLFLQKNMKSKLAQFKNALNKLEYCSSQSEKKLEEKMRLKMAEVLGDSLFDEKRFLEEMVYYINKMSIEEELVRLESHIDKLSDLIDVDGPVGRNCDFYFQEMNREVNTAGAKVNDSEAAHAIVEMKTILDQLREQIQNIV